MDDFTTVGKQDITRTISLGEQFSYACPPHGPNYGAVYQWANKQNQQFKRDDHIAVSPDGKLFIMYVTQQDVNTITGLKGIGCTVVAANTIYYSGLLTLNTGSPGKKSCNILLYGYNSTRTLIGC